MRLPQWKMEIIATMLRILQRHRSHQNLARHTVHHLLQRVKSQVKVQHLPQRKEQNVAKHTVLVGIRAICHLLQRVKSQVRMEMSQQKAQNQSKSTSFGRLLNQTVANACVKRQKRQKSADRPNITTITRQKHLLSLHQFLQCQLV